MLSILLHRRGVAMHAFVNSCPHFSLPLNSKPERFMLLSQGRIMCAWHCAVFRLQDGRCIEGPAEGSSLEPVAVEVRDNNVYLAAEVDE